jgi:superfamily II DNA or RNA helicase
LDPIFGLEEAIQAGLLVPYDYYPVAVSLTPDESEEWMRLTKQIGQLLARSFSQDSAKQEESSGHLDRLRFRRARVIKQAEHKVSAAARLLSNKYKRPEKWLVYCDGEDQLHELKALLDREELPVLVYTSAMTGDRAGTLQWYSDEGGILLAIRCLDEGIDIPDASAALILASSQNPREFIQRRGRVLRTHAGKTSATIHDLIVTPDLSATPESFRAVGAAELGRGLLFSRMARNSASEALLLAIAAQYGLDEESLLQAVDGEESDDSEEDVQGD